MCSRSGVATSRTAIHLLLRPTCYLNRRGGRGHKFLLGAVVGSAAQRWRDNRVKVLFGVVPQTVVVDLPPRRVSLPRPADRVRYRRDGAPHPQAAGGHRSGARSQVPPQPQVLLGGALPVALHQLIGGLKRSKLYCNELLLTSYNYWRCPHMRSEAGFM